MCRNRVLFLYMGGSRKDINVAKASVAAVFPMWVGVVIRKFFPLFSKDFCVYRIPAGRFPCGREYKREALKCAGTVVLFLYMGGSRKDINVAKASVAAVFPMWVGVVIRKFFPLFSKDFCVYRIPAGRFPCGREYERRKICYSVLGLGFVIGCGRFISTVW